MLWFDFTMEAGKVVLVNSATIYRSMTSFRRKWLWERIIELRTGENRGEKMGVSEELNPKFHDGRATAGCEKENPFVPRQRGNCGGNGGR